MDFTAKPEDLQTVGPTINFDMSAKPETIDKPRVHVGQMYVNQRGYLIAVVAVHSDGTVFYLRLDPTTGTVVGVGRYGAHYLCDKNCVGTFEVPEIAVEWM